MSAVAGAGPEALQRSDFHVAAMDCGAEEALVRARLEMLPTVRSLDVDLGARTVSVVHEGSVDVIGHAVAELRLGAVLIGSGAAAGEGRVRSHRIQSRILWTVLLVNAVFFLLEAAFGLVARSLGLLADSLDMLADALVYGLSLAAVGGSIATKKRVARLSGYGQLGLALLGLVEVLRRVVGPRVVPDDGTMIAVAALAFVANVVTLVLLSRARSDEAHFRASVIFTSNDVIINLGVIAAGVLVAVSGSGLPDLVIGGIVFVVVARGAVRILGLAR